MTTQTTDRLPDHTLAADLRRTARDHAAELRERTHAVSTAIQNVYGLAHAAETVFGRDVVVPMETTMHNTAGGWLGSLAEVRQGVILPHCLRDGGPRVHERTVCVVLTASNYVNGVRATVWEERQCWFDLDRQAVNPEQPYYFQDAQRGPSLPLMSPERFADYWAAALDTYQDANMADPFRWVDPETGVPLEFHSLPADLTGNNGEA